MKHLLPTGLRVLAVEDETLIALDLQEMLQGSGAGDVILARSLDDVERALASEGDIDVAIINLNPGAEAAADLQAAQAVRARGIPFLFASGSQDREVASDFSDAVFVGKPYTREIIVTAVMDTLGRARAPA
ncbi:response regulator [Bradyrhizobium sp. U87765 SZCCT0131]|uniref:response regulator n=1 Tax=unclassified Bradyrhizobium TaxID=2631580 RepID=UPI001BA4EAB4|nr:MULTISPECIES: response regulator [unclassified Bradyrhizobium]MBR1222080.1 response regulator [Bradyrhizobium sp. U87765 SZCCT0131]MBR1263722.1 response regulator [Bradyrhizobium sp. U87765 SZCCT0134]MBR1302708.1 response regulator [Bradyrhizobium sp. U87765 SZCCT0110]MBR1319972.1 response regulator [Bradyrhizobium sp. U87765 SZCCT0109]MBR1348915.1 response regulator [Bradyrhizobium sp. U87765 SZCCT0048]